MKHLRMILDEILPFYFLIMIFVIMFTGHIPTMFELYIVYGFGFGVAILNNRLFRGLEEMSLWGKEVLDTLDVIDEENKVLRRKLGGMSNESVSSSIGSIGKPSVPEKSEKSL